jgi:cell division septum initiation protein DivIVA
MTEGEFPFRSFTMRSEGYDRNEVDTYVGDQQNEIVELRRALDTATHASAGDTRLHDPEGAVTRTLAIAQETADRVLHDAQVEADRRRAEADEHATDVIAGADQRATRLLGDMEAQAAEVREQGVAAARSAIQVERDKATAELVQVRRVRDDLRTEAVDLKSSLDRYRSQAREASDALAAAASGPLTSVDLPDFIDDDVALAGISSTTGSASNVLDLDGTETASDDDGGFLRAVDDTDDLSDLVDDNEDDELADVISIDADLSDDDGAFGGTFLAEVRAATDDDDVTLAPENEDSDRFLSELRGIADDAPDDLDSDVADRFFEDD